jgi:hypothetical protein
MSATKDFKEIVAAAEKQGWRTERTRSGKIKMYAPDGIHIVIASTTPSTRNAVQNLVADLRRQGFRWRGR